VAYYSARIEMNGKVMLRIIKVEGDRRLVIIIFLDVYPDIK
jgi:hypothetical protein